MNKRYRGTVAALFATYLINGVVGVLISQIAVKLAVQVNVAYEMVIGITSIAGLIRIVIFPFVGMLSDKFGRKIFQITGLLFYVPMFLLIIFSSNLWMLQAAIVCQALSNVCTDIATYSTLVEVSQGKNANSLSMMVKAFVSTGQIIFPLIVSFVYARNIDWKVLMYGLLVMLVLVLIGTFVSPFPTKGKNADDAKNEKGEAEPAAEIVSATGEKPSIVKDAVPLIILGFLILASFSVLTSWLPKLAMGLAGMSESVAPLFSSVYGFAALIGVLFNSYLVKRWVRPSLMFPLTMALASVGLLVALVAPSYVTFIIMSVMIGAFASGGMYQLQNSVVLSLFPKHKGLLTGVNSLVSSGALLFVPLLTAALAAQNLAFVVAFDLVITVLGVLLGLYVDFRVKRFNADNK